MLTKNKIKNKLLKNTDLLRKYNVSRIGIFGSYVNGKPKRKSDIDLLVDFSDTIDLFSYVNLSDSISQLLKKKVDLVSVNGIKPYIKDRILDEVEWIEGL